MFAEEKMRRKFSGLWIVFGCLFLLGLNTTILAAEEPAAEVKQVVEETFPGVSEILPRSTAISEEAVAAEAKLSALQDVTGLQERSKAVQKEQEEINKLGAEVKSSTNPLYDQIIFFRNKVNKQSKVVDDFLAEISNRLAEIDAIAQKWLAKKTYWEKWKKVLQEKYQVTGREVTKSPSKTAFLGAENTIAEVLNKSRKTFGPLIALQKELSSLQEKNRAHALWLEMQFSEIRKNLFTKNAPSFNNPEFYNQFGPSLWEAFLVGYRGLGNLEDKYFKDQSWVFSLQVVLACILTISIMRFRSKLKEIEEWDFFCEHPVATGFFISFIALNFLYAGVPSLLRLVVWVVAATSISFIVSDILKDKRKIFLIFLLAGLSILTVFLQTISFPQPLFRLYRFFLCLVGIPFLWRMSKIKVETLPDKSPIVSCLLNASWLFKVGSGILATALVAEIGGYIACSSWLLESSVLTVFVLIFTSMGIHFAEGGIAFIATKVQFAPRSFMDNVKEQVVGRIKLLVRIIPVVYAGLFLLKMWLGSSSVGVIWNRILAFRVSVGSVDLSLSMLFLAFLFLYLSMVVSWALGLFFDKEVFPKKKVSRGVKDLVKKLVHYSLVLVGFLLALSALGLNLQNFAVLAGAFGIGIGFGLQNIVNNFVSGLILLFERPITVGDVIVFQGEWGTVNRIGLRSTVVETYDRSEVIVPNSQLVSEAVVNWTLSSSASRIVLPVGVAYGTDIEKVLGILEEVGRNHGSVLKEPPPYAIFTGFGESSLDFELRVYVGDINIRLLVKSDLGRAVNLRFKEEGVEIPFPQRDLHLRSVDEKAGHALIGWKLPRQVSSEPAAESDEKEKPKKAKSESKTGKTADSLENRGIEGGGE